MPELAVHETIELIIYIIQYMHWTYRYNALLGFNLTVPDFPVNRVCHQSPPHTHMVMQTLYSKLYRSKEATPAKQLCRPFFFQISDDNLSNI